MEEGWSILLQPNALEEAELAAYAGSRGRLLFRYTARLLGEPAQEPHEAAGEGWALADLARRSGNAEEAAAALAAAAEALEPAAFWPARLRPLGMLSVLARRDTRRGIGALEPHGTPSRMLRMVRHRLTGR